MDIKTLYKESFSRLFVIALNLVNDRATANDIVHDVFFKFCTLNKEPDTITNVMPYLFVMTRNACFDHIKKSRREEAYAEENARLTGLSEEHPSLATANIFIKTQLSYRLHTAIKSLPDQCRKVMTLSYLEGKTDEEIAELLSISEENVRQQKSIGIKKLRTILAEYENTYRETRFLIFILLYALAIYSVNLLFAFLKK